MAKIFQFKVNNMSNQSTITTSVTISDVAKAFLNMESMTPKKLQKLCYYAYSWFMVFKDGEKLFDQEFEAWVHGPVNPELYREYKEYGWGEIPKEKRVPEVIANDFELSEILESVYSSYGHFDANQLEYLTHQEKPWRNARKGLESFEPSSNQISNEDIYNFYSGVLDNG